MSAAEANAARLDGPDTTLVLAWHGDALPALEYIGPRLSDAVDLAAFARSRTLPLAHATLDANPTISLSPEPARGFMNHPGLLAHRDGAALPGPFRLTEADVDGNGATFRAVDASGTELAFRITVDADTDVVTATTTLLNAGDGVLDVAWLAAPVLPVPPRLTERLAFDGRWCGEFMTERVPVERGLAARDNRRGRTSHEAFPGTVLLTPSTTESSGEALAVHLAWSGNHRILVERLAEGTVQLQAGRLDAAGEVRLAPGESVTTPDLVLARSAHGMNGASHKLHDHVRRRVLRLPDPARPRPVTVNTWEAIYFAHDVPKLRQLADAAADLGAERFVLDDGWFGSASKGRDDDTTSLGDWTVDPRKYPRGLNEIVDHVTGLGMEFGLWVEPEMANPDSDLLRAHPDWVLGREPPDRAVTGRGQLVLDLTRADVADHIHARLAALLSDHAIGYLKWDMNRNLVVPTDGAGRPAAARQVEAVYTLLDRIRADFPHVEIESCASGGARIDYAILRRTHRFWASDSNDPVERMRVQHGFSRFLPPEVMGAHVGPAWCHTTGRGTSLALRALVASWGHMGMEMDVSALDADERALCRAVVARHKRDRHLWHGGRLHRLEHPDPNLLAVMAVAPDGNEARAVVAQLDRPRDTLPLPLPLPGLDPEATYRVRMEDALPAGNRRFDNPLAGDGAVLSGALLRDAGLILPVLYAQTGLHLVIERLVMETPT